MTTASIDHGIALGLVREIDPSARSRRLSALRTSVRRRRWLALVTSVVIGAVLLAPTTMSPVARLTLAVFVLMLVLTAFTKVNEVAACIAALVALVLVGGSSVGDAVGALTLR